MLSFILRHRKCFGFSNTLSRPTRFYFEGVYYRPQTVAPLQYEFMFKKVFTDKVNMRNLLNDIIIATKSSKFKRIVTVHNTEVSNITNAEDEDPTVLYDSCCTFVDGSMGSFKLLRTSNSDGIVRNVIDFAKLDYWQQWKTHNAFAYPVQIAVMENTPESKYSSGPFPITRTFPMDLRHACPGLHYHPPPVTMVVFNIHTAKRTLTDCTSDFERWCVIIRDSWMFDLHNLPPLCRLQPFSRAVHMLEVQKLSFKEIVEMLEVAKKNTERRKMRSFELIFVGDELLEPT